MHRLLLTLSIALAPLVAMGQTYQAYNLLRVEPLDTTSFEVIEARGEGPRGIWCAAADFAYRVKRHAAGSRIYILRARGASVREPGRKSVVFTTDVNRLPGGARQSWSLALSQVGIGLPVNHARGFCEDVLIERIERLNRIWN